jgi:hypothetical protein
MHALKPERNRASALREAIAVPSTAAIWLRSSIAGIAVIGFAIFVKWMIYFNWLHEAGTLQVSGSVLSGVLMFLLVLRSQYSTRQRKSDLITRLCTMRWMNDRIRNSLQAIECITYSAAPNAAKEVRDAVDVIESILNDFLADAHELKAMRVHSAEYLSATSARTLGDHPSSDLVDTSDPLKQEPWAFSPIG